MSNYVVSDADLTSVANAIRTKGGTSASLAFPADFVSAIQAIPSGEVSINTSYISVSEPVVTLDPCPVTYDFGECDELTVTVTATTQYHFSFSCPSGTPTILTMTGVTGVAGDTLAAGKTYEVDIWNGVVLIMEVEAVAP